MPVLWVLVAREKERREHRTSATPGPTTLAACNRLNFVTLNAVRSPVFTESAKVVSRDVVHTPWYLRGGGWRHAVGREIGNRQHGEHWQQPEWSACMSAVATVSNPSVLPAGAQWPLAAID